MLPKSHVHIMHRFCPCPSSSPLSRQVPSWFPVSHQWDTSPIAQCLRPSSLSTSPKGPHLLPQMSRFPPRLPRHHPVLLPPPVLSPSHCLEFLSWTLCYRSWNSSIKAYLAILTFWRMWRKCQEWFPAWSLKWLPLLIITMTDWLQWNFDI